MWAEWLLPCIPNTCKITGATQRPFPTQRPYTLFFSSSFFSTSFLYQSSPVSTSFSLSVVDHLILWGLRLRVENLFFFHRCSSPSAFSSPFYVGSSASLQPGYSPSKRFELIGLCDLSPSLTGCVILTLQARTVYRSPFATLLLILLHSSFIHWIIERTSMSFN